MASLSGRNASNDSTDATTSRETKAKTDTTTADSAFSNFLLDINLQKYTNALIDEGYEDFDCFDFEYSGHEDLLNELVHTVKMKRPLAQKLLAKLRKRLADVNTKATYQQDYGLKNAPSVHPDDEDEDDLPIAHEVVAVGRPNASPESAFDFTSMKKEMQDQMEADFNARLNERLAEERVARERMEQEHIARLTDERAAIKKEMELESSKAVAVAVERIKREVATSTGETKEHVGVEKTLISGSGKRYVGKISEGDENKGKGRFTCEEHGLIYDGEFQLDSFHGNGTMTWSSGANAGDKFVGEYKGSFRNGCGVYTWSSGWKYVGEFKNDKLHGQGTQFKPNGTIFHTGEWVNDKPNK